MALVVVCPCGSKLAATEAMAGKRVRCGNCRRTLTIPLQNAASALSPGATLTPEPTDQDGKYRP